MVRRRTRSAMSHKGRKKTAANMITETRNDLLNIDYVLDDDYYASPKMKQCRNEKNFQYNCNTVDNPPFECITLDDNDDNVNDKKYNNKIKGTVTLNNNVSGKYTGTTRSSSSIRTLDNFFKINGPAKKSSSRKKLNSTNTMKLCPTLSATLTAPISVPTTNQAQQHQSNWHDMKQLPNFDCLYEFSNDTNDSEQTDLTDELPPSSIHKKSSTLMPHSIRFKLANTLNFNNNCTTTVAAVDVDETTAITGATSLTTNNTDNIFLQEPVLTLNIDKTPNQASSIKINKSLEIEPKFASRTCPTIMEANHLHLHNFNNVTLFNINNNKYPMNVIKKEEVKEEEEDCKREKNEIQKDLIISDHANDLIMLPENDNSSCDSGVVFISSSSSSTVDSSNYNSPPPLEHKPTTPHRIVWPSPRRDDSPDNVSTSLSPRKSQRHNNNIATYYTNASANNSNNDRVTETLKSRNRRKLLSSRPEQKEYTLDAHVKTNDKCKIVDLTQNSNEHDVKVKVEKCDPDKILDDHDNDSKDDKKHTTSHLTNKQLIKNNKIGTSGRSKYIVSQGQRTAGTNGNRSISEFFPVRRSARKTKSAVKEEMMRNLENAILEEHCNGLKVEYFEGKGRGVVAERHFQRGEFVIEYIGDLISIAEAAVREARYALDENAGCYMYYFEHKNQQYCIDATEDTGKLGRLVNHARYGNLLTKVVVVKQIPHLVLIAKKDIKPGEELCYDYGDRSKDSLRNHPWLAF